MKKVVSLIKMIQNLDMLRLGFAFIFVIFLGAGIYIFQPLPMSEKFRDLSSAHLLYRDYKPSRYRDCDCGMNPYTSYCKKFCSYQKQKVVLSPKVKCKEALLNKVIFTGEIPVIKLSGLIARTMMSQNEELTDTGFMVPKECENCKVRRQLIFDVDPAKTHQNMCDQVGSKVFKYETTFALKKTPGKSKKYHVDILKPSDRNIASGFFKPSCVVGDYDQLYKSVNSYIRQFFLGRGAVAKDFWLQKCDISNCSAFSLNRVQVENQPCRLKLVQEVFCGNRKVSMGLSGVQTPYMIDIYYDYDIRCDKDSI